VSPSLDLPIPPPQPAPLSAGKNFPPSVASSHDDVSHAPSQYSSHKSATTTFTSNTKDHPPLRETDSVNAQYHLNINDLLSSYPVVLSNKMSHLNQTKDIERLILRYNTPLRLILKKYSLSAAHFRNIQNTVKSSRRDQHPTLRPPTAWQPMELLIHNKRSIHDKFFTLQMHQVWQFARDCELIGPLLTAYDVCECVKALHSEYRLTSLSLSSFFA
jgi:hypothetical protein